MRGVKVEFPEFDDELPEIDGFVDRSWANESCPCLLNEELHLQLFVDFVDPELSEFPEERLSGDLKRFGLYNLTEDNMVMSVDPDIVQQGGDAYAEAFEAKESERFVMQSDDRGEIVARIDSIRAERAAARTSAPSP